jgi:hypothetical protein
VRQHHASVPLCSVLLCFACLWLAAQVVGMLAAVMQETLPDAAELVTPPTRASTVGETVSTGTGTTPTAAGAAAAAAGGQGLSQPRPPYTLREGVGMRRLLKFRVAAGVQLLLVQAASEMYAQQYMHLGVSVVASTGCSCDC